MATVSTNLQEIRAGGAFPMGKIHSLETIGEYTVATVLPYDTLQTLMPFYYGWVGDTFDPRRYESIEAALAGCIAFKHEGEPHRADRYFLRMVQGSNS